MIFPKLDAMSLKFMRRLHSEASRCHKTLQVEATYLGPLLGGSSIGTL